MSIPAISLMIYQNLSAIFSFKCLLKCVYDDDHDNDTDYANP